jgi:hypothetical protein
MPSTIVAAASCTPGDLTLHPRRSYEWGSSPGNPFIICLSIFQNLAGSSRGGAVFIYFPKGGGSDGSGAPSQFEIHESVFESCESDNYGGAIYYNIEATIQFWDNCFVHCKSSHGRAIYYEGENQNSFLLQQSHIHRCDSLNAPEEDTEDAAFSTKLDVTTISNFDIQRNNFSSLGITQTQGNGYANSISLYVQKGLQLIQCQFTNITNSSVLFFGIDPSNNAGITITDIIFNAIFNGNESLFYVQGSSEKISFNNVFLETRTNLIHLESSVDYSNKVITFVPLSWAKYALPETCNGLIDLNFSIGQFTNDDGIANNQADDGTRFCVSFHVLAIILGALIPAYFF